MGREECWAQIPYEVIVKMFRMSYYKSFKLNTILVTLKHYNTIMVIMQIS